MKNSKMIIDVNAKDDVVVVAVMNMKNIGDNGSTDVKVQSFNVDASLPHVVKLFSGVNEVLRQLAESNVEPDRYTLILPEAIALRAVQAIKAEKDGTNAFDTMYLSWMQKADENDYGDMAEEERPYYNSISGFAGGYEILRQNGFTFNFFNARKLYRWELINAEDENAPIVGLERGMELTFVKGVNEEYGIKSTENNLLSGVHVIEQQSISDRNGNTRVRWFARRDIQVDENGEPKGESNAVLANVRKLRTLAAEKLPRIKLATTMQTIEVAAGDSLFA